MIISLSECNLCFICTCHGLTLHSVYLWYTDHTPKFTNKSIFQNNKSTIVLNYTIQFIVHSVVSTLYPFSMCWSLCMWWGWGRRWRKALFPITVCSWKSFPFIIYFIIPICLPIRFTQKSIVGVCFSIFTSPFLLLTPVHYLSGLMHRKVRSIS